MNPPLTHDQAVEFFADLYDGEHHIPGPKYKGANVKPYGDGFAILTEEDLSSFDFNRLTRLVLMAHDRCIRVEVSAAMRKVKIAIWQRKAREADRIWDRHPTIETAIANHRKTWAGRVEKVLP